MTHIIIPIIVATSLFLPVQKGTPKAEALVFAITVYQYAPKIALHYPKADNVRWDWVCVETWGKVDDKQNPGEYEPWYQKSCWTPRFALEDYALKPGADYVKGTLTIYENDVKRDMVVSANIKPEENVLPDPLVPFPGEGEK